MLRAEVTGGPQTDDLFKPQQPPDNNRTVGIRAGLHPEQPVPPRLRLMLTGTVAEGHGEQISLGDEGTIRRKLPRK
ncbi:hypothetical protein D3C71_1981390 [compost metagenome]